jgi:ribose-phosphate pyrophosphokinase
MLLLKQGKNVYLPFQKMISQVKIFTGQATEVLAEKISTEYGQPIGKVERYRFSDGELQASYEESIRGHSVFIIQSTMPPADNLMEMLLLIDAAKRASARHIVAVMPYYGYARQDRKDKPRVAIGAKLVADMLAVAGATRVMTMDLHADQIQGFFNVPVDHLYASTIFLPYIKSLQLPDLTIAAPDMGGSKRANGYAKHLKAEMVICYKQRAKANVIENMTAIGEMEGRNIILVDDLVDTGGTLCKAADMMMKNGAKSVRAICTHPVLSGKAYENIENSQLQELIVTDTIPLKRECDKIKVLSVAPLFAKVINSVHNYESISSNFIL